MSLIMPCKRMIIEDEQTRSEFLGSFGYLLMVRMKKEKKITHTKASSLQTEIIISKMSNIPIEIYWELNTAKYSKVSIISTVLLNVLV